MIPMEELEGRLDGGAHRILVRSVADAHMNTLRVWGGGIYYPREFYEACDDYGIMLCVRAVRALFSWVRAWVRASEC